MLSRIHIKDLAIVSSLGQIGFKGLERQSVPVRRCFALSDVEPELP